MKGSSHRKPMPKLRRHRSIKGRKLSSSRNRRFRFPFMRRQHSFRVSFPDFSGKSSIRKKDMAIPKEMGT